MGRKRKSEPKKTKNDRFEIRARLLAAGQALFSERGMHGCQVSELAGHAGVSVGAFYRYFRDKDELYREILRMRIDAYLDEMRSLLANVDTLTVGARVDLLRGVFRRSFEYHLRDPEPFLLWYRHGHSVSPEMGALVDELTAEAESLIADILDRTITIGGAMTRDQRLAVATSLLGMANAMTHRMIARGTPDLEEAVEICTRMAAAGLLGFAPAPMRASLLAIYDRD